MTVAATSWITAHQGGWDEALLVAVPVALFAGLLALANRRAGKLQSQVEAAARADATAPGPTAAPTTTPASDGPDQG